jgi:hypothetical protein
MGLALKPHVLDRILVWGIGRKAHAGDFPLSFSYPLIFLGEKLLHLFAAMVTGPIPQEE